MLKVLVTFVFVAGAASSCIPLHRKPCRRAALLSWHHLGDGSYNLEPWEYDQDDDLLGELEWSEDDAFAQVTCSTPGARYTVYGSIIDNVSGDPIYVPAMR